VIRMYTELVANGVSWPIRSIATSGRVRGYRP
jgi:hypothetical protein